MSFEWLLKTHDLLLSQLYFFEKVISCWKLIEQHLKIYADFNDYRLCVTSAWYHWRWL